MARTKKAKSYRTSIPLDKSPNPADYNKDGVVTAAELKRYKKAEKMKRKVTKVSSKTEQQKEKGKKKVDDAKKGKDKSGNVGKILGHIGTGVGIITGAATTAAALKNR